jgi:hypothetical protein
MRDDDSKIISLASSKQKAEITISPAHDRVVGRRVLKWSAYCGTYGQGGPGFFGLQLAAGNGHAEEWLILRLWSAPAWLTVNGRWLDANQSRHPNGSRPLHSNFHDAKWDEFAPLVTGQTITSFDLSKKSFELVIGSAKIEFSEDPASRPIYAGSKKPRILSDGDDLRIAWIIAPWPWVEI